MDKKTVGLSDAFKGNTAPKRFTKNPIKGIIVTSNLGIIRIVKFINISRKLI